MTRYPRLVVMTSDKSDWTLQGLFSLLLVGVGRALEAMKPVVFGYRQPEDLWKGATFQPVDTGKMEDYPTSRWSDSLLWVLNWLLREDGSDPFWLILDDYWPTRRVDYDGILSLAVWMSQHPDVLKMDLARDRLNADPGRYYKEANGAGSAGHYDLIESQPGTHYHMSLWGGLWNPVTLRQVLQPGWSAQQVELEGTSKLSNAPFYVAGKPNQYRVLGTRQGPFMHTNILSGGKEPFQFCRETDNWVKPEWMEMLRKEELIPQDMWKHYQKQRGTT